jgi:hypothetical protein
MDQEQHPSVRCKSPSNLSQEWLEALGKWALAFNQVYRQPMSDITLWAYQQSLYDLTIGELNRGCSESMKFTRFTPTPAEIRDYGILETETYGPVRNALPSAERPMTDAEAKEFFALCREKAPWLNKD